MSKQRSPHDGRRFCQIAEGFSAGADALRSQFGIFQFPFVQQATAGDLTNATLPMCQAQIATSSKDRRTQEFMGSD